MLSPTPTPPRGVSEALAFDPADAAHEMKQDIDLVALDRRTRVLAVALAAVAVAVAALSLAAIAGLRAPRSQPLASPSPREVSVACSCPAAPLAVAPAIDPRPELAAIAEQLARIPTTTEPGLRRRHGGSR